MKEENLKWWEICKIILTVVIKGFSILCVLYFLFFGIPELYENFISFDYELEDLEFVVPPAYFTYERDINNERWEMVKNYLGAVEWTDKAKIWSCVSTSTDTICERPERTYLTSDPLKKEWVELECDEYFEADDNAAFFSLKGQEILNRCRELKEITNK